MKIEVYETDEKVCLDEIKIVEKEMGILFPKEYIEFLLDQNGGNPKKSEFQLPDGTNTSVVNVFYPIGKMEENLQRENMILDGEIPEGYISIGDDSVGNEILLKIKGENIGELYFWDHDVDSEEENNMHFLANNLNAFLNILK